MKECAACNTELSQDKFSKKQWKLKQHERRCKDCIDNNNEVKHQLVVKSNTTVNEMAEKPHRVIFALMMSQMNRVVKLGEIARVVARQLGLFIFHVLRILCKT